jgi:hypothetical protein
VFGVHAGDGFRVDLPVLFVQRWGDWWVSGLIEHLAQDDVLCTWRGQSLVEGDLALLNLCQRLGAGLSLCNSWVGGRAIGQETGNGGLVIEGSLWIVSSMVTLPVWVLSNVACWNSIWVSVSQGLRSRTRGWLSIPFVDGVTSRSVWH